MLTTDEPDLSDPRVRAYRRLIDRPDSDRDALVALLRSDQPRPAPETLSIIGAPVLICLGDRDRGLPAERLRSSLPASRLVMVPELDHFATPSHSVVKDTVVAFLTD